MDRSARRSTTVFVALESEAPCVARVTDTGKTAIRDWNTHLLHAACSCDSIVHTTTS